MKKIRIHRGWLMAALCMIMVASTSLLSTGFSTCLNAIRATYGISATLTSTITTVRSISAFVIVMFANRYFKKFGIRVGISIAMLFGAAAFLLFALADGNIAVYFIAAAVGGFTYAFGVMLSASILINRWFRKHRGMALSIASAGTGLCSIIGAPVLQRIINIYGITTSFFVQSGFLLIVAILLLLLVRNDPADVGAEPVGGADYQELSVKKTGNASAVQLPAAWLWVMVLSVLLIGITTAPASSHLTLNFTTDGLDAMTVAKAISVYGFVLIASKMLYGVLIDKIGAVKIIWIYGSVIVLAKIMAWGATFVPTDPFLFTTLIIYGLGVPIETLGYPNWAANMSTREEYPIMLKKLQLGYQLGGLIGASLPGVFCDLTGTYGWFYLLCAILNAASLAIVLIVYRRFVPSQKN